MLDFGQSISTNKAPDEQDPGSTIQVFYHSQECQHSLQEACQSEGMGAPASEAVNADELHSQIKNLKASLIFIETDTNTEKLATSLCHMASRSNDIVLIGQDDSISLIRKLASLGFYYLLWPASRQDIVELLRSLRSDRALDKRPQSARTAMRIAVVGMKGGCGSSLVAVETATNLIEETSQPVLLVDHNYHDSNLHILLGKPSLNRKRIDSQTLASFDNSQAVDSIQAQSQLVRIQTNLNYFGLDNTSSETRKLWSFSQSVLESQTREHSFIVEDYPSPTKYILASQNHLSTLTDCLIIVIPPTLSGLYATRGFLQHLQFEQSQSPHKVRLLAVINHSQPDCTLNLQDAEEYLEQPVAAELPWQAGCENQLIEGHGLKEGKQELNLALENLTRCIIGKPQSAPSLWQRVKQWCLA